MDTRYWREGCHGLYDGTPRQCVNMMVVQHVAALNATNWPLSSGSGGTFCGVNFAVNGDEEVSAGFE